MTLSPTNRTANSLVLVPLSFLLFCAIVAGGSAAVLGQTSNESVESEKDPAIDDPYGINRKPKQADGIGVDDKIGDVIVGDVSFNDHNNNRIRFGDFFDGKRPVMLSFNYSNCPKLCSVQLENMTSALREVDFKVGEDFQLVSLSIDPTEQTSRARESRAKFMGYYNQPESGSGWHFLTGDRKDIEFLTDQCGFRYKYVREQKLYSHPPVFILLSPEGKIVRYIHGLSYDPTTIRRALIESAEGKIGSAINQLAYGLGCFSFNESTGKYTVQAMAIMRIGGGITALGLLLGLVPYWFFSSRRGSSKRSEPIAPTAAQQT